MIADNTTTRWLRRYHPASGGTSRLVCFPHAGGSASFFHPLSTRFSSGAEVISLQYPGRQDRRHEPVIDDIAVLADLITAELAELPDKPTVFFGHSMGAVLAFETAWRLERAGAGGPYEVIASGRRGPATRRDEAVHLRVDEGVIDEVRSLDGTSAAVLADDELIRMALPAIRGDYKAIETYRCPPDRRVRADLTVLTGDADPKTTAEEALAWQHHTEGAFRVTTFPGGHFFLTAQSAAVGDEIDRALAAVN